MAQSVSKQSGGRTRSTTKRPAKPAKKKSASRKSTGKRPAKNAGHSVARHAQRRPDRRKARRRRKTGPGGVARPRPFTVRRSGVQGKGGFAWKWIPAGTRIVEYVGDRISPEEADSRYDDEHMRRHHTFLFAVDDDTVIDAAVGGNEARFINHSCEPNCEAVDYDGRIFIEALRDIAPGEELFYDYAYELGEKVTPALKRRYPCYCGSPGCRGTILYVRKR